MTKEIMRNESINVAVALKCFEERNKEMKKLYLLHEPTITIDALVALGHMAYKSRLNAAFCLNAFSCSDFLFVKHGFTRMQSVVLSVIVALCQPITVSTIAYFVGLPKEKTDQCQEALDDLVAAGVLTADTDPSNAQPTYYLNAEAKKTIYAYDA